MARTPQTAENAAVPAPRRNMAAEFSHALTAYRDEIKKVLPADIPLEFFERVIRTAVAERPELWHADRQSFMLALVKSATDGLLPDGREAVLNIYNTEIRRRNPQTGLDEKIRTDVVQYQRMVGGVRKMLERSGEVLSATAEAVYANDEFDYQLGDDARIHHKPPKLGKPRGDLVGAYAIIRLANGGVLRDVMDWPTIEKSRNQNPYWQKSLMWSKFPGEGAKKTVLLRLSKSAPRAAAERVSNDERLEIEQVPQTETEPEPQRPQPRLIEAEPEQAPEFEVLDYDGVARVYGSAKRASEAMLSLMAAPQARDPRLLEGLWESNEALIDDLASEGFGDQANDLIAAYDLNLGIAKSKSQPGAGATPQIDDDARIGSLQQEPGPVPARDQGRTGGSIPPTGAKDHPPEDDLPRGMQDLTAEAERLLREREDAAAYEFRLDMVHTRGGKPNPRGWAVAVFIPRLRRVANESPDDIPYFLGDNEEHIAACLDQGSNLSADDRRELDQAIENAKKAIP